MKQDARWLSRISDMKENYRNESKLNPEKKLMVHTE